MTDFHPLSGVGIDHAGLEILTLDTCHELLEETPIGRLAFVEHGEPMILPITYGMWGGSVVFATDTGSKLDAAVMSRPVAVEIDGWDADSRSGWSVVVRGTAMMVDARESEQLDHLSVTPWVRPEEPKQWVRVLPYAVPGRRTRS